MRAAFSLFFLVNKWNRSGALLEATVQWADDTAQAGGSQSSATHQISYRKMEAQAL